MLKSAEVWDPWSFFKLLDIDGGGSVEIEEFFMGCLRFSGQARAMDVGKIIQEGAWPSIHRVFHSSMTLAQNRSKAPCYGLGFFMRFTRNLRDPRQDQAWIMRNQGRPSHAVRALKPTSPGFQSFMEVELGKLREVPEIDCILFPYLFRAGPSY